MSESEYDGLDHIFHSLANQEIVAPYLEKAMMDDVWPDRYTINIDKYKPRKHDPNTVGYFYPSTHPLEGERLLYYSMHPVHRHKLIPWKPSLSVLWSGVMGTVLHGVVQTQLKVIGKITDRDVEVRVRSDERRISGRIDFLYHHDKVYPVELKTQNGDSFDQTHKITPYWNAQLQLCMDLAGFDEGILLLMRMGYPWSMKEFRVKRDPVFLEETYSKFERVLKAVKNDTPPVHCCEEGSKKMDNCPARYECWLAGQRAS